MAQVKEDLLKRVQFAHNCIDRADETDATLKFQQQFLRRCQGIGLVMGAAISVTTRKVGIQGEPIHGITVFICPRNHSNGNKSTSIHRLTGKNFYCYDVCCGKN